MTNQRRRLYMTLTICVCVFYLVYRGLFTLNLETPFAAVFSITLYVAEIYGNALMWMYFFQIWNPTLPEPVPPLENVKVDAYIPTYDEDAELLRGTIEAAVAMDYPHETYVLDDGKRPEIKELCEELGAKYLTRESNIHAKAGNLNHAMEITDGEFVIIFDADHIAERHFITRTLGYFADEQLAFIQTPHSYYNFDSFQGTLDYDKQLYWEEGQLFYNIIQPGKNHWNSASFCGSAAIFRKKSLEDVGLIATESITEDMQTGLRLHSRGWKSLYINERLVSGLAAPDIKTFTIQRLRWGEGNLGTIFYDNPITMPGLSFAQRLNYLGLMLNWTTGVQKAILYFTPLLMLLSGVGPVVDMTWHLVAITLTYVLLVWYTVKASGCGYGRLFDTEVTQMATFWTQCRGTWRAVFNRKNATFVVTQKSGGSKASGIHQFLRPQYTYIGASVVCVTWAASRYFLGVSEDFLGLSICSFLVFMHCVFAWIVIRRALAQRRFDWRHPAACHVQYRLETSEGVQEGVGFTKDLSETGVGFVTYEKLNGYTVQMTITAGDSSVTLGGKIGSWSVLANVKSRRDGNVTGYRYGVEFDDLDNDQKRMLWHMCTKYAVARRYIEFDPNESRELDADVAESTDVRMLLPVRLFRPDTGDVHTLSESVTNNAFTVVADQPFDEQKHFRATLTTSSGEVSGNARRVSTTRVDLGQMPLWAHRFQFDAFDGQSRGILTTLINLSPEPTMRELTTLQPKQTKLPTIYPATIVGTITGIAATITVIATLLLCQDEVLMARAILDKPIDVEGQHRLAELVEHYEKEPNANERHFLRLREAMKALEDAESMRRLNMALIENEWDRPAARLQRAYALEQMEMPEEAFVAFGELLDNIEQFRSRSTRLYLKLAAARNATNLELYDRAIQLYEDVWLQRSKKVDIRAEYAGVLTTAGEHARAAEVLTSGELTEDDKYLLVGIHVAQEEMDEARKLAAELIREKVNLKSLKLAADLHAWTKEYEDALTEYESILSQYPNDIETRIAMVQVLVWDKQFRKALSMGENIESDLLDEEKLPIWIPMLEAISELEDAKKNDQKLAMRVYSARAKFADDALFLQRLAEAMIHVFEPDRAAPLVEQLFTLQPDSRPLQTIYARILYRMGDFNAAADHYEQLISGMSLGMPSARLKSESTDDDGHEQAVSAVVTTQEDLIVAGELLLAAALNSSRRGAVQEARERYDAALKHFRQLMQRDHKDTKLWLPFLNAVSGSREHSIDVTNLVMEIYNTRDMIRLDAEVRLLTLQRLADALSRIDQDPLAIQVLDELASQSSQISAAQQWETDWRRANVLLRLKRHQEAEAIYLTLLNADPNVLEPNAKVPVLLAAGANSAALDNLLASKTRYAQAVTILRDQLSNASQRTDLWLPFLSACAGLESVNSQDLELVLGIYQERQQLTGSLEFTERLRDVLLTAGEYKLSLPLFKELLEAEPDSTSLRFRYAQVLQALHNHQTAEENYQLLLKRRSLGENEEELLQERILLSAAHNAAAQGLGTLAVSRYRAALSGLRPVVARDVENTKNWRPYLNAVLGSNSAPSDDSVLVNEIYDLRDMLNGNDSNFSIVLAESLALFGREQHALDLLIQTARSFPDDTGLRRTLARIHSSVGENQQAASYYNWLIAQSGYAEDPVDRSQLLLEAAQNDLLLNQADKAGKRFESAFAILATELRTRPHDERLWQPYLDAAAMVSSLSADCKRTVLQLYKRWPQRDDDLTFMDRLVDVLVKCGYKRRAVTLLEQLEKTSSTTDARFARMLSEIGEYARAEVRFKILLANPTFVANPREAVSTLLAAARNAKSLGESQTVETRYRDALVILRNELKDNPFQPLIAERFLDALAGAQSISKDDENFVHQFLLQWSDEPSTSLRERLADVLLKLDREKDALPVLQQLRREMPDSQKVQLRLANTLQGLGQFVEAEALYQLLLANEANDVEIERVEVLVSAARNSLAQRDYVAARDRFERLLKSNGRLADFDVEYAISLDKTGDTRKAVRILGQKTEFSDEDQFLLASMLVVLNDFGRAEETYKSILENDPTNLRALRELGNLALWSRQFPLALQRFEALQEKHPHDISLRYAKAMATLGMGNVGEALVELTMLTKLAPQDLQVAKGFLQAAAAAPSLTRDQWSTVVRIDRQREKTDQTDAMTPSLSEALADVFVTHDRVEKATRLYEISMATADESAELQVKYATALARAKRFNAAIPILVELADELPQARLQLAFAFSGNGDLALADEQWMQVLAHDHAALPLVRAQNRLAAANVSRELKHSEEASARFGEALQILTTELKQNEDRLSLWLPFLDAAAGTSRDLWSNDAEHFVHQLFQRRSEHPPHDDFLLRLSDVMSHSGKFSKALDVIHELPRRLVSAPAVQQRLANCYLSLESFDKALPLLTQLVKSDETNATSRQQLASTLQKLEQYSAAETHYQLLLDNATLVGPARWAVLLGAARNSVALKEMDEARRRFEEFRQLAPADDEMRAEYAGLLLSAGEAQKAIAILNQVDTLSKIQQHVLAGAYEAISDRDAAQQIYQRVLDLDPDDGVAQRGLARTLLGQRKFEPALNIFDELLEEAPDDRDLRYGKANCHLGLSDFHTSTGLLTNLVDHYPDDTRYWLPYVQSVAGAGHTSPSQLKRVEKLYESLNGASENWERLTSSEQDEFLLRLADIYLNSGLHEAVVDLVSQSSADAIEKMQNRKAIALLSLKRAEEALPLLKQWLAKEPNNLEVVYLYALSLTENQQHLAAREQYDRLVSHKQPKTEWLLGATRNAATLDNQSRVRVLHERAWSRIQTAFHDDPMSLDVMQQVIRAVNVAPVLRESERESILAIRANGSAKLSLFMKAELLDALVRIKENPSALELGLEVVEHDDAPVRAHQHVAHLLVAQQEYGKAQHHFDVVLSDPNETNTSMLLASATNLSRLNQAERANELFIRALHDAAQALSSDTQNARLWQPFLDAAAGVAAIPVRYQPLVLTIYDHRQQIDKQDFVERLADVLLRLGEFDRMNSLLEPVADTDAELQYRLAIAKVNLEQDKAADALLGSLLERHAFQRDASRHGELWLFAASISSRIGDAEAATERYQIALQLWRSMLETEYDNHGHWPRYLDAVAGASDLDDRDLENIQSIMRDFGDDASLTSNLTFVCRLIDVGILVGKPDQVLPISRDYFNSNPNDEIRLRLANNLHAVGLFDEAEPHYDHLIANSAFADDDQTQRQLLMTAARNNASQGKYSKARRAYEKGRGITPPTRRDDIDYAVILMKTGDVALGQQLLERAPLTLDERFHLASMYTSTQDLALAEKVYAKILLDRPDDVQARRRRAQLLIWRKDYVAAQGILYQLLSENPRDTDAAKLLANSKLWSGHHTEARDLFRELMADSPNDPSLYVGFLDSLGSSDLTSDDQATVRTIYDYYCSRSDQQEVNRRLLARALAVPMSHAGLATESIQMLESLAAITDDPAKLTTVTETLAQLLMTEREFAAAISQYEKLIAANDLPRYRMQLAFAHYNSSDYSKADRFFEPLLSNQSWLQSSLPQHVEFVLAGADNKRKIGQEDKAERISTFIANALLSQFDQQATNVAHWSGLLRAVSGMPERKLKSNSNLITAIKSIYASRRLIDPLPSERRRALWLQLANALQRTGSQSEAEMTLETAIQLDPQSFDCRWKLAELLRTEENYAKATRHYSQLTSSLSSAMPSQQIDVLLAAAQVNDALNEHVTATEYRNSAFDIAKRLVAQGTDLSDNWPAYVRALNAHKVFDESDRRIIEQIYEVWKNTPPSKAAILDLGYALELTGFHREAIEFIGRLPDSDPWKYWRLAAIEKTLGNYETALKYYQQIIAHRTVEPKSRAYFQLSLAIGDLMRLCGDLPESRKRLRRAANFYRSTGGNQPANHDDWLSYANALRGLEQIDSDDKRLLKKSAEIVTDVTDSGLVYVLAELAVRFETPKRALAYVASAIEAFPADPSLQLVQAKLWLDGKQFAKAMESLENIDVTQIQDTVLVQDIQGTYGRACLQAGKYEEAASVFESLGIENVPNTDYALALSRTGRLGAAIQHLEDATEPGELAMLAALYIQAADYNSARSTYEFLLQLDGNNKLAQRGLADISFWSRDYEKAIQQYEVLLAQAPDNVELRESYGKSLLWVGRYADALPVLREILKQDFERTDLWLPVLDAMGALENVAIEDPLFKAIDRHFETHDLAVDLAERLARVYAKTGETLTAFDRLRPFVERGDATPTLLLQYGDVLADLERFDDAIAIYQQFFERSEHTAAGVEIVDVRLRYADVLHRAKRFPDAQFELEWVLSRVDGSNPARYKHALISGARNLVALDRVGDGLRLFERLRQFDPESFFFYEEYAGALLSAGRANEALEWIGKAPELTLNGRYLLGAVFATLQEFHRASETYRSIINSDPRQLRAWKELANVSLWGDDTQTAIHIYGELLTRLPDDIQLKGQLARAYLKSGRTHDGLQLLSSLIRKAPNQTEYWADFLQAASRNSVVLDDTTRATMERILSKPDTWPTNISFKQAMASALLAIGEEQRGIELLSEIVEMAPNNKIARRRLADELHNQGSYEEADAHYEQLLNRGRTRYISAE